MLKKIFIFLLINSLAFSASFLNPNTFKGTEKEKKAVVAWIKQNIKEEYSAIGMDNPSTLRMMEKQDLDCFKNLLQVKDKALLEEVIKTYSSIGMDTYNTFWMMYQEEKKPKVAL
jgi:hypothetical protein